MGVDVLVLNTAVADFRSGEFAFADELVGPGGLAKCRTADMPAYTQAQYAGWIEQGLATFVRFIWTLERLLFYVEVEKPDTNIVNDDLKLWQGSNIAITENLNNVAFLRSLVHDLGDYFAEEEVSEEGVAGLNEVGVEEILQAIKSISSEEVLEKIEEELKQTAEEVLSPPTIILDYADVEVGTDYAIITWETDKESNTIVALVDEDDYDEDAADPYRWREGGPDDMTLEHRVEITGLNPATVYHFQVSSQSTLGLTGYSSDKIFKTKSVKPEIYNIQLSKVEEESATIRYTTNVPCSSIIDYTNLNTNDTKLEGNSSYLTVHRTRLTNLIFDTYYSFIVKVESEDQEKAESAPITFITIKDEEPPVITKVNTESTIYPGSENKIQTIASWRSDEPAQCQLFYHQGLVVIDEPQSLIKEEDFAVKHVQVITNFLPSTVYKFWIVCDDEAGNASRSEDFTMLTPTQEESIIDIIIKNFESTFGWLKKMKI